MVNGSDDPAALGGWRRARGGRGIDRGLVQIQPLLGAGLGAAIRRALDAAGVKPGSAVIILPDGASALLPLSLAKDPQTGRTLIEDYEISFTPSLAALAASHRRIVRGGPRSLGLLRPPPGAALAYAPIEGELVAARFDADRRTAWDGAQKDTLLSGLGPRTYWHFATHGGFDWKDPRRSGLLIGENLSLLQLSDLLDARRRIGAPRLVVLSACDSGLSDVEQDPDEFTGLPMGFIFAGAAGVVASLWPVNDLSTTLLMGRFYDLHLGEGQAPAHALRAAELWLKDATLADLQAYVKAKRAAGVLTESQAQAMIDALDRAARGAPAATPIFAPPRYWGAFSLYGQ
jgi:CHAT domain-containing protein